MGRSSHERVKTLLKETITLLCKNGIDFTDTFSIEAVIGVTIDEKDVFLVSMNELVKSDRACDSTSTPDVNTETADEPSNETTTEHRRKRRRHEHSSIVKQERLDDTQNWSDPSQEISRTKPEPAIDTDTSPPQDQEYSLPIKKHKQDEDEEDEDEDSMDLVIIKEEACEDVAATSWDPGQLTEGFSDYSFSNVDPSANHSQWTTGATTGPRYRTHTSSRSATVTAGGDTSQDMMPYGESQEGAVASARLVRRDGRTHYQCELCADKFFSTKDNLRGHMSWHTGVKEFQCPTCGVAYRRKRALDTHRLKSRH